MWFIRLDLESVSHQILISGTSSTLCLLTWCTCLSVWIGILVLLFSTTFCEIFHLDRGGSNPYSVQSYQYTRPNTLFGRAIQYMLFSIYCILHPATMCWTISETTAKVTSAMDNTWFKSCKMLSNRLAILWMRHQIHFHLYDSNTGCKALFAFCSRKKVRLTRTR